LGALLLALAPELRRLAEVERRGRPERDALLRDRLDDVLERRCAAMAFGSFQI
jgi:hypothetical protein